jgi:hypothetical protein
MSVMNVKGETGEEGYESVLEGVNRIKVHYICMYGNVIRKLITLYS